jgi:hypothetical protein
LFYLCYLAIANESSSFLQINRKWINVVQNVYNCTNPLKRTCFYTCTYVFTTLEKKQKKNKKKQWSTSRSTWFQVCLHSQLLLDLLSLHLLLRLLTRGRRRNPKERARAQCPWSHRISHGGRWQWESGSEDVVCTECFAMHDCLSFQELGSSISTHHLLVTRILFKVLIVALSGPWCVWNEGLAFCIFRFRLVAVMMEPLMGFHILFLFKYHSHFTFMIN